MTLTGREFLFVVSGTALHTNKNPSPANRLKIYPELMKIALYFALAEAMKVDLFILAFNATSRLNTLTAYRQSLA